MRLSTQTLQGIPATQAWKAYLKNKAHFGTVSMRRYAATLDLPDKIFFMVPAETMAITPAEMGKEASAMVSLSGARRRHRIVLFMHVRTHMQGGSHASTLLSAAQKSIHAEGLLGLTTSAQACRTWYATLTLLRNGFSGDDNLPSAVIRRPSETPSGDGVAITFKWSIECDMRKHLEYVTTIRDAHQRRGQHEFAGCLTKVREDIARDIPPEEDPSSEVLVKDDDGDDTIDDNTLASLMRDGNELAICSEQVRSNKTAVLTAVRQTGWALMYASDELKDDFEVVFAAVCRVGLMLEHASPRLRDDRDVVLAATETHSRAFQFASGRLQNDRDMALQVIAVHPYALEWVSTRLRADRDVVLAAVRRDGLVLEYAHPILRADRDTVLEAISNFGGALRYASDALRADRNVVVSAVTQNVWSIGHASAELRGDRELMMTALNDDANVIAVAPPELRADRELVSIALRQNGNTLQFASDDLRADRELVMMAVTQCGDALHFASVELRADRAVALTAILTTGEALDYVSSELQSDRELVLAAVHQAGGRGFEKSPLKSSREFIIAAVTLYGHIHRDIVQRASYALRHDPFLVKFNDMTREDRRCFRFRVVACALRYRQKLQRRVEQREIEAIGNAWESEVANGVLGEQHRAAFIFGFHAGKRMRRI